MSVGAVHQNEQAPDVIELDTHIRLRITSVVLRFQVKSIASRYALKNLNFLFLHPNSQCISIPNTSQ